MIRKLLLCSILVFTAYSTFAQIKNLSPLIRNNKSSFIQTEKSSTLLFELNCSESDVNEIRNKAKEIALAAELSIEIKDDGTFMFRLKTKEQNHAEYIQKMLIHLGFETFVFESEKKSISELPGILKSL